ncbi:hypothetical protein ONZ43_g2812 [Nemania bipapillata]|uniref:Uncharacterized protein n=1 Tax=Nemania bipapillata TaxID=110536 RepID=A0ACC2IZ63_9PEZI|nr:hypothetical protein ONZ43_g2812 [Nemania bipapillata]
MSAQPPQPLYQTTTEKVPEYAFRAVIWFAIGICTVASAIRFAIRFASWRRLLPEDYIMLLALVLLIAIAGVLQTYVGDIYYLTHVQNGIELPGPDFQTRVLDALRADGIVLAVGAIGIYAIKLNFLFFFYRIGNHVKAYLVIWWASTFFIISSLAINLGVIPYKCSFGNIIQTTVECATEASVAHIYLVYKLAVALDVICDALSFTIGVTIVRVSIFHDVYDEVEKSNRKVFDTTWVLFWLYVEYLVSFIINCIISFRSLWVNQKQKAKREALEQEKQKRIIVAGQAERGIRRKWQALRNTILDTCAHLEGTTLERGSSKFIQIEPPSGNITVDFSNWGSTQGSDVGVKSTSDSSQRELHEREQEHYLVGTVTLDKH